MAEHKNGMEAKRGRRKMARFCRIANRAFRTRSGPNRPAAANGVKLGRGVPGIGVNIYGCAMHNGTLFEEDEEHPI